MKINEKPQMRSATEGNHWDTKIHRVHEHSYLVSLDTLKQETQFQSKTLTLTEIHKEFIHSKENILNIQGFIHIKEYSLDAYECRCHEHTDILTDKMINNSKEHLLDYKLEF
ncbi:unnamed protein product [Rotaria magnacalcarata]|uniref:Uncharacterized protein n=2 Tax=Rotaria magnacalcarata TaxID=392030 RepID=A0A817AQ68_9BILA|nr:unnamed protein product [Rotaria magnacalcarata]